MYIIKNSKGISNDKELIRLHIHTQNASLFCVLFTICARFAYIALSAS